MLLPARVLQQDKTLKELFRARIRDKVNATRQRFAQRLDEEVPSWLSWALKPTAGAMLNLTLFRDNLVGKIGETIASSNFWLFLPSNWTVINDVVLEPQPDEFAQIDHVLVGPPGVFLIETKAWDGTYLGVRDMWKRKEGSRWVKCPSPTAQNKRHKRLMCLWLRQRLGENVPASLEEWLMPIVLMTRTRWLRVDSCSMPVFNNIDELLRYIRTRQAALSQEEIEFIVVAIITATPYQRPLDEAPSLPAPNLQEPETQKSIAHKLRVTKDGRQYVTVEGTREEAEEVHLHFKQKGAGRRARRR